MRSITNTTAAPLKSMLCFIDPKNAPKIAIHKDELADPLTNKIKEALGDKEGADRVSIMFNDDESDLREEFIGVASAIQSVFSSLQYKAK